MRPTTCCRTTVPKIAGNPRRWYLFQIHFIFRCIADLHAPNHNPFSQPLPTTPSNRRLLPASSPKHPSNLVTSRAQPCIIPAMCAYANMQSKCSRRQTLIFRPFRAPASRLNEYSRPLLLVRLVFIYSAATHVPSHQEDIPFDPSYSFPLIIS